MNRTKNYYDGIARGYARLYHEEQKKKIELLCPFFPKEGIVCDLGSGDGVLNSYLEKTSVISLDLSFELLSLNSSACKICVDIEKLPFQNESLQGVCSFTVLQDTPQPESVIKEVWRTLKNEGIFCVTFLKMSQKAKRIENALLGNFVVELRLEEEKDLLFVCRKIEK